MRLRRHLTAQRCALLPRSSRIHGLPGLHMETIIIHKDNKFAVALAYSPEYHSRTMHIETLRHFIREAVQRVEVTIDRITSKDNAADICTEPLLRPAAIRRCIGMTAI